MVSPSPEWRYYSFFSSFSFPLSPQKINQAVKENLETLLLILPKIFQLIKTATCDHKAPEAPAV